MKLLVVRFSSIGDIVLTTPVLRALREQLPDAEIHYLTKEAFKNLLDNNSDQDKIYTIKKSISEVIPALKMEKYDQIIDLHNNLRTRSLRLKLRVKTSTFPKLNFKKWLLVNFKWHKMPGMHVVDRYFEAVLDLGVVNKNYPANFIISPADHVDVKNEFGLDPGSYVSIVIGAKFATKKMPVELLVKVIKGLKIPAILVGGKEDQEVAKIVMQKCGNATCFSATGKFNIAQSASIVKQSAKVLSNDTGMMHIASIFDLPIISVWGSTVPELGMYPYRPDRSESVVIHEVADLSCRPCSKIGFEKCPKGHFKCMLEQNVDAIVGDLNR